MSTAILIQVQRAISRYVNHARPGLAENLRHQMDNLSLGALYLAGRKPLTESPEQKKMLAGKPYDYCDAALVLQRKWARYLLAKYNATGEIQKAERARILHSLLGSQGENVTIWPSFYCEYGGNLHLGNNAFINVGCIVIDSGPVTIGNNSGLGPGVKLLTPDHPTDAGERITGKEWALPIRIGNNVWIGAGSTILSGATIGDNTVITAGAVVIKNQSFGPNVMAGGVPCRVIKDLSQ